MCSLSNICLTCVYCDNFPPCHCSCTGDASVLFNFLAANRGQCKSCFA